MLIGDQDIALGDLRIVTYKQLRDHHDERSLSQDTLVISFVGVSLTVPAWIPGTPWRHAFLGDSRASKPRWPCPVFDLGDMCLKRGQMLNETQQSSLNL